MEASMFIRIAWFASTSVPADPKDLRRLARTPRRDCDDLGIPAPDFAKMTKSLFDRQD